MPPARLSQVIGITAMMARSGAPSLVTAALLSALLWLGAVQDAEAHANVWTTNGPEGGTVLALAIDSQTPTTIYAGTGAGVFALQQTG